MKINYKRFIGAFFVFLFSLLLLVIFENNKPNENITRLHSSSSPKAGSKMKKGRWEYFNRMLRDPKTKEIPKGIRQKELAFARELEETNNNLKKSALVNDLGWQEAGPFDVGGRTRALGIDVTNSNTIIVGGVSGGIWKSTDKGNAWSMKSTTSQVLSVTSLAQDPRPGQTNNWYYATGEFDGSADDIAHTHKFSGDGIYKSTDNGETWNLLPSTASTNPVGWDSPFDYVYKIEINPTTGSIFVATQGFGVFKSSDGGNSFNLVLGGTGEHYNSDVSIASDGTIVAAVSSPFQGYTPQNTPGIYKSTDDGNNWTNITPTTFPPNHYRNVIEIAPSNTSVAYVLTFTWEFIDDKYDDVRFHKINISNGASEDRSANMPSFAFFGDDERINTQGGYNLTLAVKPDDENLVLIGATSLFRSTDGFATKPSDAKLNWIGGYHPTEFSYPNFHSDVHSFAFDPANPNAMWWGHDGGLSYTTDISTTSYQTFFPWQDMNNGYNVTQFYMVTIPDVANDNRIMGGTQDNGTPSWRFDGSISPSYDVSSGDGAFAYFGTSYPYVSSQNGAVIRGEYNQAGDPRRDYPNWSNITPSDASNQLFINPFVVDPMDENIMIYPAGNTIWRNNQLNSLPYNPSFASGISDGWTQLTGLSLPTGYRVSALAMSKNNPSHRLYFGGSEFSQQPTGTPKLYRLDNANTASSGAIDISIQEVNAASFLNSIIVNPDNADEIIAVFSNYNIVGVYHSLNAGQSFTPIEGNLVGTENNPGPSIRSAAILPTSSGTQYFLATSTGVYSTNILNGSNTVWSLEGASTMGNVVVNSLASRTSDGKIVAGTHGRGAFVAYSTGGSAAIANVNVNSLTLQSRPGQTGSTSFVLSNNGEGTLNYNISVTGSFGGAMPKINNSANVLYKADLDSKKYERFRNKSNFRIAKKKALSKANSNSTNNSINKLKGNDYLYLDDGDTGSDSFVGWGDGSDFDWYNEFNVSGFNFEMDSFEFFVRTETAFSNEIYAAIYDENFNLLSEGYLSLNTTTDGSWFTIPLSPSLSFNDGETFYIELYSYSFIPYPAGADTDAQIQNKSFYYDGANWVNLNTISGFETGAFLIRAIGTVGGGGGGNQNPVAIANISKTQAEVSETITFDASQSYDNDGSIAQYLWDFGDGSSSTQQSATHSYSQANSYTYTLTVTDNQGASGQTTGQIVVSEPSNQYVIVDPSSGSIPAGGSQTITLTLNAQTLQEGTYTGQVNVSTNGGNILIPIDYLVDVEKFSNIPTEYNLSQNYPNPFNPSTTIEFSLPEQSDVQIIVYDMLGKKVAELINESKSAGKYKLNFDASFFASGIYLYSLKTNNYTESKKMLLLK